MRAWQRMLSGRRLDLLNPDPADVELADIAHGLARVARWNGQTRGRHAFSVAQHSLLVERILTAIEPGSDSQLRLTALLHDAPEYVIGDLISPFKAAIGFDYKAFELRLLDAILARFRLTAPMDAEHERMIKQADRIAAYIEAVELAGFGRDEAETYFGQPTLLDGVAMERLASDVEPLETSVAQADFFEKATRLLDGTTRI